MNLYEMAYRRNMSGLVKLSEKDSRAIFGIDLDSHYEYRHFFKACDGGMVSLKPVLGYAPSSTAQYHRQRE